MHRRTALSVFLCTGFLCAAAGAQNDPVGEPLFDPPTLHCIGARWFVEEAKHPEAGVTVAYRRKGDAAWKNALPFRRVETAALIERKPAEGISLYAGSIFGLKPDTVYEVNLTLTDRNGQHVVKTSEHRTWKEPIAPAPKRTVHVRTPDALAAAGNDARPGDLILIHKGTYPGTVRLAKSGTAESPIVWRAAPGEEAVIEGPPRGAGIKTGSVKHVFIEGLTVRNTHWAIVLHGSSNVTVRRCKMVNVGCGVTADYDQTRLFIVDNVMKGPRKWPPVKGRKVEDRGVQVSGVGHVVAFNRISHFRDGVDTRPRFPVRGIDIHNNDISEMTDDGIELDYSESNCRAYENRITNVNLGISFQPSRGGPNYAVRNVLLNVDHESFKLHLSPVKPGHLTSGGVILHNTIVKKGPAFRVWSNEGPAHYFYARNNLYVTSARGVIEITCPMKFADFDYNLYATDQPIRNFASWNKTRYKTLDAFRNEAGQEKHGIALTAIDGILASDVKPPVARHETIPVEKNDLRLAVGSPAVDRGETLPNINDGFKGNAPDIGALELGDLLPHYGPRAR